MFLKKCVFNDLLISVAWIFFSKNSYTSAVKYFNENSSIMKILNVAEKNDAAKNIANILSRGASRRREGLSVYNKLYEFECSVNGQKSSMVMTSVSGHLLNWEFVGSFRNWSKCRPLQLFDAPVVKGCNEDMEKIKKTLEKEAKSASTLVIWTDCDREGENIGFEIISVCKKIKPNLRIYRAKFSEITKQSIWRALETLTEPNEHLSQAVDVRSELDLRIGAAFTRFQTLRLQKVFPTQLSNCLISYGSCQFPTLGFVVERYNAVQSFVSEQFWKIKVEHTIDDVSVDFNWKRVRLFDEQLCRVLYEKCLEKPIAKVDKVTSKPKSKRRPVPLDTVEFEKIASRKLGINAKEAMKVAEKLYTQGIISYPRTETNIFPKQLDLVSLIQQQIDDPNWGEFAGNILGNGPNPRQGKKTDEAHPPIHPTKYVMLSGTEQKVYEYIVRHFLACVSNDAKGHETIVDITINDEKFVANGLMILERNYLDVYPYEKWSDKEIHKYEEGQTFNPNNISMIDGHTSAPDLLTEADLIALMEKHGIGTDATHADHIETIKSRLYVGITDQKYFVPGQLGMGLVEGYDSMGFAMSKPNLRAELEADLQRISEGRKDPQTVLKEQIERYREVFIQAEAQVSKIDESLGKYLEAQPVDIGQTNDPILPIPECIFKCPSCGTDMAIQQRSNGGFFISCLAFPNCKTALWFPSYVTCLKPAASTCPECGPTIRKLDFTFRSGALAPYYPNQYVGCINGCEPHLMSLLNIPPLKSITSAPIQSSTGSATDRSMTGGRAAGGGRGGGQYYNQRVTATAPSVETTFDVASDRSRGNGGGQTDFRQGGGVRGGGVRGGGYGRSQTIEPWPPSPPRFDDQSPRQSNTPWNNQPSHDQGQRSGHSNIQWNNQPSYDQGQRSEGGRGRGGFGQSQTSGQWPPAPGSNDRSPRQWNKQPSNQAQRNDNGDVVCNCGESAKRLIVQKESVNKGRPFYKCAKMGSDACSFFLWGDDTGSNDASRRNFGGGQRSGSNEGQRSGSSQRSSNQRKCSLCHQTGHTRRNCPNA